MKIIIRATIIAFAAWVIDSFKTKFIIIEVRIMNDLIMKKCELLVNNKNAIHRKFLFENDLMSVVAGLIFTEADKEADIEKMRECRKILRKKTNIFSKLRATVELALLSSMALSEDPEKYINDVTEVYEKFSKLKLVDNTYMVLASMLICDTGGIDDIDDIIAKSDEIMKQMDKKHPFLTSSEDTSFSVLLALSYKDVDTIINDIEEGYSYIKKTYKSGVTSNAVQCLCEVLAVTYGDMKSKCDKVMRIYKAFDERKSPFGKEQEFAAIGTLTDINLSPDELAGEILETDEFLKNQSGFKSMDKSRRMMYATLLVADVYGKDAAIISNPLISNTLSIITAQRIAKIISIIGNIAPSIAGAIVDSLAEVENKEGIEAEEISAEAESTEGNNKD